MAESIIRDLIGKNVVVIFKSGFKKFGILIDANDSGITLKFKDGRLEYNSFDGISTIIEDKKVMP